MRAHTLHFHNYTMLIMKFLKPNKHPQSAKIATCDLVDGLLSVPTPYMLGHLLFLYWGSWIIYSITVVYNFRQGGIFLFSEMKDKHSIFVIIPEFKQGNSAHGDSRKDVRLIRSGN